MADCRGLRYIDVCCQSWKSPGMEGLMMQHAACFTGPPSRGAAAEAYSLGDVASSNLSGLVLTGIQMPQVRRTKGLTGLHEVRCPYGALGTLRPVTHKCPDVSGAKLYLECKGPGGYRNDWMFPLCSDLALTGEESEVPQNVCNCPMCARPALGKVGGLALGAFKRHLWVYERRVVAQQLTHGTDNCMLSAPAASLCMDIHICLATFKSGGL
eukprot:1159710-Pelagomonas_calceolata.AAC.2